MSRRRKKLKGLIFDIDGTLIDSNDLHAQAWVDSFEEFGKTISFKTMRMQIGKGGDLLVPDLLTAKEMQSFGNKLTSFRKKHFKKNYLDRVKPFPAIREQFETFRGAGIRMVLASSASDEEVAFFTDLLEIEDLIEGSTSASDADVSKPSPEIFEAALEKLGTPLAQTFTVGDTPYDVLASHRASLPIVAVRSGKFPQKSLEKAEFIFRDVSEVHSQMLQIEAYLNA